MTLRAAALAAAAVLGWSTTGRADDAPPPVRDAENRYELHVPDDWQSLAIVDALLGAQAPDGAARLVVTRVDHPNRAAWRSERTFFSQVERGVARAADGYRRLHRRRGRLGRVPHLDLRFRRRTADGREVVAMRFLFFRRYSLILTVSTEADRARRQRRTVRRLVRSFVPYFAPG